MAGHEPVTGTGLGLPIARDLARRMGGDLDVASVPDAGSAFVLVLPGPTPVAADGAVDGRACETRTLAGEEQAVLRGAPPAVPSGRSRAPDATAAGYPPTSDRRRAWIRG